MLGNLQISRRLHSEFGGAAIEYIIVSAVGLLVAAAATAFLTSAFETKLRGISERLDVDPPELDFGF